MVIERGQQLTHLPPLPEELEVEKTNTEDEGSRWFTWRTSITIPVNAPVADQWHHAVWLPPGGYADTWIVEKTLTEYAPGTNGAVRYQPPRIFRPTGMRTVIYLADVEGCYPSPDRLVPGSPTVAQARQGIRTVDAACRRGLAYSWVAGWLLYPLCPPVPNGPGQFHGLVNMIVDTPNWWDTPIEDWAVMGALL